MWIRLLFPLFGLFPLSFCWIEFARINNIDIIRNNILPVNYFYVQFLNIYGYNVSHLTEDEQNSFQFSIKSDKCRRFSTDKIYTGGGLFILRIRNFEECHNIEIELRFNQKHLTGSPLCFKSLYPENCNCPRKLNHVIDALKCDIEDEQIEEDLNRFTSVNFTQLRNFVTRSYANSKSSSVCNYVIKSNKIFRKCYGQYVGFKMFMDSILISLRNKVTLPDIELFINLGDWPLIKKSSKELFPMFSWCGSSETMDIVLPTYDLTESTIHMMHRITIDVLSVQREKWKWNEKIEKGFFRGRDSRRERLELVTISKNNPELLNASITNFFFYNDEISVYGPKVDNIPLTNFFQYKYQINMDGTVAAYRLPYLLAGNSVVLKQKSHYYEFFYRKLKPYQHYIPFARNPNDDLLEKINWLKKNDAEAIKIMRNAREFVNENLTPKSIFCYYILVLKKFSERIVSPIEVHDGMEMVDDKEIDCSCKDQI